MLAGSAFIACSESITYPSISENDTKVHHPGQFVWHDLVSPNPKASLEFYKNVFGWTSTALGSNETTYHTIYSNGKAIGGISKLDPSYGTVGEWIGSMSVSDVSNAVKYNKEQGGKTIFNTMNAKGRGKVALVQDPQGAIISFIRSESGDPDVAINQTWLWNELWTDDLEASTDYYKSLVPYATEKAEQAKNPYHIFTNNDKKLAGIMAIPVNDMRTSWIPYIRVNDIKSVVEKAKNAGAYIIMEPSEKIRNGTLAFIQDPVGAKFALQQLN